jgi:hypothetical protein
MKTVKLNESMMNVAKLAVETAPAETLGLRVADLRPGGRIDKLLEKLSTQQREVQPTTEEMLELKGIELEDSELKLLQDLWSNFDIGNLLRIKEVRTILLSLDDALREAS